MVTNAARTQAVCSLGWVHKGSLWVYRVGSVSPEVFKLSDAKYLTIKAGNKDFFSVVHHWGGDNIQISAHNHAEPRQPISSISLRRSSRTSEKTESDVTGDSSVWRELPRAYVAYAFGDFHLFLVDLNGSVSCETFSWYSEANYDKGYQGIVAVEELPASHLLIVCVQRDSNPILYDPHNGAVVKKLNLADRRGNPQFKLRASLGVQSSAQMTQQFIGEFSLCRDETLCLVARPFSNDVIGIDCDSMHQTHKAALGKQPLKAGLLEEDRVVALDWKTGEFLMGRLEKT
jgi:hypothetical protein